MTDEKKKQYTLKISNANQTQLVVILYDMLLDYVADAEAASENNDFTAAIRRARGCVRELSETLDFQYAPAKELFSLYRYVDRELAKAQYKNSKEPLQNVPTVIRELREAFNEVAKQDTSPAVMENAQAVYAGLTYGKTDLNLSLTDEGTNRGFRV